MRDPILTVMFVAAAAACGPHDSVDDEALDTTAQSISVPSEDHPDSVDVGSWNLEWYGDPLNGPSPEWKQRANVEAVLPQLQLDLVGLVEVVSEYGFQHLLTKMPGYSGILATDPLVENGAQFYSASEQKVALLFQSRFTVESARLVLTESAYQFAGRPPMEVKLKWTENGRARSLVVLVVHLKAMANEDGWTRRTASAAALKSYLDATYPTRWVLVIGDWNDDLDTSTFRGHDSPFAPLVSSTGYRFTTDALTQSGTSTTVGFSSTIDHHLATDELAARFVAGSAKVLRLDGYVTSYGDTTSDHFPVVTRYDLR